MNAVFHCVALAILRAPILTNLLALALFCAALGLHQ